MSFSYQNNTLHADSVAIPELVDTYGSPLYVYSRTDIENNWREFDQAFGTHPHLVCYAVKANSNLAVLNVLAKIGAGFDIVSIGELERVLAAGGTANKCVFSGVAKTAIEIERALEVGVRCFNVESASELNRIESVARSVGKQAPISIRVNPNVDAKTHPYISTGLKENKFGVDMSEALDLYQHIQHSEHLTVQGLDCHIGSQITDVSPFLDALDKVLTLLDQLNTHNINIQHLDLGGGVGINYEGEETINIQAYIDAIISKVGQTEIILEPGRAIVGNAGIFITKVEFLKQNSTHAFAIVNGAMNDLLRPSFYNAYHQVLPINKTPAGTQANWNLVGPICETGDFLAKNRDLSLSEGDYLALMSTGAYGFTMSSNYNSRPRVAEVIVSNTNHQLIRKRETVQDLFANEYLYEI
ncbi:Diaminopimelate decarboxylase [Bathymodiolus thermophilus thioautotrophic gill symbiont]|uniref:Diaminopimelate decarboxylase n=1 Tax=Bathymodiolus thermophilus thioautotrophic gill symbiont TaxID=2360 RepID=A0A3G3IPI7_9GAMM|nr:diaminopimelate decarboxylase [Bathymodiolus thermophilus thioautotrophic gill symbiont]AYQ57648.1 Diaminopimelate decarboxylase [Bathymodiolus thermophilus thioautotrophic gill symbiont]